MCGQWPAVGSTPMWFSKNEANYRGRAPTRVSPTPAPCPPNGSRILTEAMQRGESGAKGWCSHHSQMSPAIIPSVYGHWLWTSQGPSCDSGTVFPPQVDGRATRTTLSQVRAHTWPFGCQGQQHSGHRLSLTLGVDGSWLRTNPSQQGPPAAWHSH